MLPTHRIVTLLACSLVFLTTGVRAESGPEDVLRDSFTLLAGECDFDCCYRLAGLYSRRFLGLMKDATVTSLESNDEAEAIIADVFGAKADSLDDIETLTPREVFARNTCHTTESVPIEYRYTEFEIIRTEHPTPDTVEYYIRLSGLKVSPNMTEEAFYRLVREDGAWRIDQ